MQQLYFEEDAPAALLGWLAQTPHSQLFVFVDANVAGLHAPHNWLPPTAHIRLVQPGEDHKTLSAVQGHYLFLHNHAAARDAMMLAIGGGLCLDVAGYVAATWKRGLCYATLPTTLLAMVDASIGGKTGVNFSGAKNIIGAFHPPKATFFDVRFLGTLPRRDTLAGYAEVLKHGLVADAAFWAKTSTTPIDEQPWRQVVRQSVAIKQRIVAQDPHEAGPRAILNFGHTVGHALESLSHAQQRPLLHGEAVALGMLAEAWLSVEFAGLPPADASGIQQTLLALPYPWDFHIADIDRLVAFMAHDKKRAGNENHFALLQAIGCCKPAVPVPTNAVVAVLKTFFRAVD